MSAHQHIEHHLESDQQVRVSPPRMVPNLDLLATSNDQMQVNPSRQHDRQYAIPFVNEEEGYTPPSGGSKAVKSLHANDESSHRLVKQPIA